VPLFFPLRLLADALFCAIEQPFDIFPVHINDNDGKDKGKDCIKQGGLVAEFLHHISNNWVL